MNIETMIEIKHCDFCNKDFESQTGSKSHFTRVHNIVLSKKREHKKGESFCPHPDCKGKPGFINENKLSYHFQAKHGVKYVDYLRDTILRDRHHGIWPLCACGCKKEVPFYKTDFSVYLKGHHHKGKKFSEESKMNMKRGSTEWQNNLTEEEKHNMHKKAAATNKSRKQIIREEARQKAIDEKYNGTVPKCPVCGHDLEFVFKWRDFRKFCSVKCINTGRKETDEHREKIRINTQKAVFAKYGVNTIFKLPHMMKRKKISKVERRLSEILGAKLGFALENKSYDMIKDNVIIEVEGYFYHPDKLENLTMIQANNATNDFSKLEIAKTHPEYELLKIRESKIKEIGFENISIETIRKNTYKQDFSIYTDEQVIIDKNYFESLKRDKKSEYKITYCIAIALKFIRRLLPDFSEIDDDTLVSALRAMIGNEQIESIDFTVKSLRKHIDTDCFFTKKDTVHYIVDILKSILDLSSFEHIIEPSAGNGSISLLFENCEAYDIFPQHSSIKKADFFDLHFDYENSKVLIVGNPPFGKQSSLALKFIKRSCEIADTIAFILPRSFKKDSVKDKIPLTHDCVFEMDLDSDSFEKDGVPRAIRCVFQVWIRKNREKSEQYFSKDFSFCLKEKAQFSFRRVGANAGETSRDIFDKNESSHYFIKTKENINDIIKMLNLINWSAIKGNTVAVNSISKNEIYMKYLEEKSKK
jgi:hypothetical protein